MEENQRETEMTDEEAERIYSRLEDWGCDVTGGLERFLDDDELYLRCLRRFAHDPSFINLQAAIREKDWKRAYESAHSLKGSSGTLNLTPLYEATRRMTTLLSSKNMTLEQKGVTDLLQELGELYSEYCRRIRR